MATQSKGGVMQKSNTVMNILGDGTRFKGNISVRGSLRVDGEFNGEMKITDTLIVGKGGKIKGQIKVKNCVVGGVIDGILESEERVELQANAKFDGDLICKKLVIEEGVIFDGNCLMSKSKINEKVKKERPVSK
jgi:cytoskeletal protein CcmA (bactofilin family)